MTWQKIVFQIVVGLAVGVVSNVLFTLWKDRFNQLIFAQYKCYERLSIVLLKLEVIEIPTHFAFLSAVGKKCLKRQFSLMKFFKRSSK